MNPRLAVTAVITLVIVLVFIGYLLERKRAVRKRELEALREKIRLLEAVVENIRSVAAEGKDLDITAERVELEIQRYENVVMEKRKVQNDGRS